MARKITKFQEHDDKAAVQLSFKISRLVGHLYRKRGYTQASFAEAIGYTRSSLCVIMHTTDVSRLWRLPAICAAARVLGVSAGALISAAEELDDETDSRLLSLQVLTFGLAAGSDDRFSVVVKDAAEGAGAKGDLAKDCSIEFISIAAPGTLAAYRDLGMTDEELYTKVRTALADYPGLPVWAALGKYEQEGKA